MSPNIQKYRKQPDLTNVRFFPFLIQFMNPFNACACVHNLVSKLYTCDILYVQFLNLFFPCITLKIPKF